MKVGPGHSENIMRPSIKTSCILYTLLIKHHRKNNLFTKPKIIICGIINNNHPCFRLVRFCDFSTTFLIIKQMDGRIHMLSYICAYNTSL